MKNIFITLTLFFSIWANSEDSKTVPRNIVFVGVDVSGSFLRSKHFDNSLKFLAKYIYLHLNGKDDLEVPHSLFVGPLGGAKANEAKTFYPIETFRGSDEGAIYNELQKIFPKKKENPFTDYNAFFKQVVSYVQNRKLVLKPLNIIMISDGAPDLPHLKGEKAYGAIDLSELEMLSRNVTIRLLYTNAVIGDSWQNKVKRRRIKIWTQDAVVMEKWKDPKNNLTDWIKSNVDFYPPAKIVN
ncbi:MAG: hypothetical protein A4S09_12485 [Proteobacteria bacterium SG_bin7]|nr:MAG: hypothetical protein A4S09_12485 [Proteobacteria bacterium SG_bin7]